MLSQQLRRAFLTYFQSKGHTLVPSSPVVPFDDPSLLFINAGMNQFKDVFLGKSKRDYTRATTTQKCIRVGGKHNDLDNVGHTSRHLTFFEMLGNFSFGDYFKKEAIAFAWEVATKVFELEKEKIWVSVYQDDDEAFSLWQEHLPSSRIVRLGEKDNFWMMGDTGPCGPCSELLYDRGETYGKYASPEEDTSGERFFEFWNLVFMQFERDAQGNLSPLPNRSIDTGMGLERIVSLKMGVNTLFETDIFQAIIRGIEHIAKKPYDPKSKEAPCFHVIADHLRSLAFAIADGVQPSNTNRGYVLRKILRRAVRYARQLEIHRPFLAELFPKLLECMGEDFPELEKAKDRITEILTQEEEAFLRTLQRGGNLLQKVIDEAKQKEGKISGEDAFKLKDTYGFPIEEILLIAKDAALSVDFEAFSILEKQAKELSRKAKKGTTETFEANFFEPFAKEHPKSSFEGYTTLDSVAEILGIVHQGNFIDTLGPQEKGILLLNRTPFYAEMGGQAGDRGTIHTKEASFKVEKTDSPFPGVIAHTGVLTKGTLQNGQSVQASVDVEQRKAIQNNHTATHLLHYALEKILGSHIKQAGSLVEAKRLRFDFNHHKPLSIEELQEIESLINARVRSDLEVKTYELSYQEVQKRDDVKQFFGEKYGHTVRVVDMDFSKELCGGTHTQRLGTIGLVKIIKESSIAAGVRRIEAVSGKEAELYIQELEGQIQTLSTLFKIPSSKLLEKAESLFEEKKELEAKIKEQEKEKLLLLANTLLEEKETLGSFFLVAKEVDLEAKQLTALAEILTQRLPSAVFALAVSFPNRCQLLVATGSEVPVKAKALIQKAAPFIEGKGGGKDTLAQAGGQKPAGLPAAFDQIRLILGSC